MTSDDQVLTCARGQPHHQCLVKSSAICVLDHSCAALRNGRRTTTLPHSSAGCLWVTCLTFRHWGRGAALASCSRHCTVTNALLVPFLSSTESGYERRRLPLHRLTQPFPSPVLLHVVQNGLSRPRSTALGARMKVAFAYGRMNKGYISRRPVIGLLRSRSLVQLTLKSITQASCFVPIKPG